MAAETVEPPMVLPDDSTTRMPNRFGDAITPDGSTPMKFPVMVLALAPSMRIASPGKSVNPSPVTVLAPAVMISPAFSPPTLAPFRNIFS